MPLLIGGAVLAIFALLSLSAAKGPAGRRKAESMLLGAAAVAAVVLVAARTGPPGIAMTVVALWLASHRFASARRARSPTSKDGSARPNAGSPPPRRGQMGRAEAYQVLGLEPGASPEEVLAQYRRLMKKVHPDQGGTTYLATRLNEAKDALLGGGNRDR